MRYLKKLVLVLVHDAVSKYKQKSEKTVEKPRKTEKLRKVKNCEMVDPKVFLLNVFQILNLHQDAAVIDFCLTLGLVNFHLLEALKEWEVIDKAVAEYKSKGGKKSIEFAAKVTLRSIGTQLFGLGFKDFEAKMAETRPKKYRLGKKYPLMDLLLWQLDHVEFDKTILDFAELLRCEIGPNTYELLCSNIPLPSLSLIDKRLQQQSRINEGELQVNI